MAMAFSRRLTGRLVLASAQPASASVPGPSRRAVSGFPPHIDKAEALPKPERDLLVALAQWVVETHEPDLFPVIRITCIGHADRDFQRGPAYEKGISERRARAVLEALKQEIHRHSIVFVQNIVPIVLRIQFASSGVGATEAKPAVNEKQRLRNRRVTIVFERGNPNKPPQPFFDILEETKRVIQKLPFPLPKPDFFTKIVPAPKKDEWKEFIKLWRKSPLRFVDFKTVIEGVIDAAGPPADQQEAREQWAEGMVEAHEEDTAERRGRTNDPPGDPDEEDDETEAPPTKQLPPKKPPLKPLLPSAR